MLADKLLSISHRDLEEKKKEDLINFLVSESGNHNYTINRKEARGLGLTVEKPDDTLYDQIKDLYDSVFEQLKMKTAQDKKTIIFHPILIESVHYGSDMYSIELKAEKQDDKTSIKAEGWLNFRCKNAQKGSI